jgi:hypothetical protein
MSAFSGQARERATGSTEGSGAQSSLAALITAVAALLAALGGLYVAIREPNANKVSEASEEITKANSAEHDQLVKLVQAVDDLSKNVDQNHSAVEELRTYIDTSLFNVRRGQHAERESSVAVAGVQKNSPSAAPSVAPLRRVSIPTQLQKPPLWNARTNELER